MLFTYAMHIQTPKTDQNQHFCDQKLFSLFKDFFLVPRSLDQISLKNEKDFQHFVSIIETGIDNKLFEKQFSRHHQEKNVCDQENPSVSNSNKLVLHFSFYGFFFPYIFLLDFLIRQCQYNMTRFYCFCFDEGDKLI